MDVLGSCDNAFVDEINAKLISASFFFATEAEMTTMANVSNMSGANAMRMGHTQPSVALGQDGVLRVHGTAGDDNLSVTKDAKGNVVVKDGDQTLGTFNGADVKAVHVRGGRGADTIKVDVGNDIKVRVRGGRGDDNIEVDGGKDVFVRGGRGKDTLKAVGVTGAHIMGGRGDDDISVSGDDNTVGGILGDNSISVDGQGNTILTQNGNDQIIAPGDNQQKDVQRRRNARDLCAELQGKMMVRA